MIAADELKNIIRDAFKDAPRPSINEITQHECWECDRVRDDFARHRWDEVPKDTIEYHRDSLALFSPAALRYFLGSYLLYSVNHPDSEVTDYIIYHLSPSDDNDYRRQRFSVFSGTERSAICTYLSFLETLDCCAIELTNIRVGKRLWCESPTGNGGHDDGVRGG